MAGAAAMAALAASAALLCVAASLPGFTAPDRNSYSNDLNTDLQYIRECNQTSPISLDVMNRVLVHKRLLGIGDENFKCFLHCLYKKYGWMDNEGSFLVGTIQESLKDSELSETTVKWLAFKCTAGGSPNPCERAFKFTQCFWDESRQFPDNDDAFDFDMAFRSRLMKSRI